MLFSAPFLASPPGPVELDGLLTYIIFVLVHGPVYVCPCPEASLSCLYVLANLQIQARSTTFARHKRLSAVVKT